MGIIKGFTFDGVDSLDYNIGITGSAVYNAPTRDVEMISIPGRDGEYALDHGRFNNIEITYPAGMYDTAQTDFATRISELRNQLASRVGYKRLEDEYNPDEYRMAIYKSGLEVSPVQYSRAGQFDIIFDCKPQRFLKSGETATSVANNGTITNPTLFDSHPLLNFKASGDGTINIGSQSVSFINAPYGIIELPYSVLTSQSTDAIILDNNKYNTSDTFTLKGAKIIFTLTSSYPITAMSFASGQDLRYNSNESRINGDRAIVSVEDWQNSDFVAGTSKTVTKTASMSLTTNGTTYTKTITLTLTYNGVKQITVSWSITAGGVTTERKDRYYNDLVIVANSSVNTLTGDLYIDLDIGEAYTVNNGTTTSINNFVNLGGELPVLPANTTTTVTYSNTITNFKITPRWYKI